MVKAQTGHHPAVACRLTTLDESRLECKPIIQVCSTRSSGRNRTAVYMVCTVLTDLREVGRQLPEFRIFCRSFMVAVRATMTLRSRSTQRMKILSTSGEAVSIPRTVGPCGD